MKVKEAIKKLRNSKERSIDLCFLTKEGEFFEFYVGGFFYDEYALKLKVVDCSQKPHLRLMYSSDLLNLLEDTPNKDAELVVEVNGKEIIPETIKEVKADGYWVITIYEPGAEEMDDYDNLVEEYHIL